MASNYTQNRLESETAVIASGQTISSAVASLGRILVGIITPAALTGTSATLKISFDGTTFYDYYNPAGNQVTIALVTDIFIGILPADLSCVKSIKLVSSGAEGAERTFTLVYRGM